MKKILFVIDSLNSGGAEKSLVSLLSLIDYNKYEIDLLMFSPKGLYLPLLPKEINVLDVPDFFKRQSSKVKTLLINRNYRNIYIRLKGAMAFRNPLYKKIMHPAQINWRIVSKEINRLEKEYDVAIAYSQGMPTYFVAEKVIAEKKLSWLNIDYKVASYNKNFDLGYYEKFNNIIAVSHASKEVFIEEMPTLIPKVTVVYDIISPSLIKSMASEKGGFQDKFEGLRILTIGRLVHQKGYEMAIEACYRLKQKKIHFKWFALGEGTLKEKLRRMIKEYGLEDTFILLGTHQNPYTFLKQCDIYVQPSRFEGYGLAIAEARILLKPIVATNFTIVHNQIRENENGIIVEMNSEALYKGIKKIIEDRNLREYIKSNLGKEDVGTEDELFKIYKLIEH